MLIVGYHDTPAASSRCHDTPGAASVGEAEDYGSVGNNVSIIADVR